MNAKGSGASSGKRRRISQTDVPRVTLEQALRVPRALAEQYGKQPARPLDVAAALEMSPTSGPFRSLCGAAIGYGLTDGGPNASHIALTELGRQVVAPLEEDEDLNAQRKAALTPAVERQFLEKYDGSPLPVERIGRNVLESLGVPEGSTERVFGLIVENAQAVGFIKRIKDKTYVDLGDAPPVRPPESGASAAGAEPGQAESGFGSADGSSDEWGARSNEVGDGNLSSERMPNRRVFVSHGRNKRVVSQLKELLAFGDFEPLVSVEREAVSKPVPQKVMDDMRAAGAGIIHVSSEERLLDGEGNERRVLNQNVLIEIGAAMALYGDRFVLLVEEGTALPSNLQGLYEVRYSGEQLDYDSTMKVLKALNQFKAQ